MKAKKKYQEGGKMPVDPKNKKTAVERRYERVEKRISKAHDRGPEHGEKAEKKYGYNYRSAIDAGLGPDETGHWPSRNPNTGEILKGPRHPTFKMTKKGEKAAGYKIVKINGIMYSFPKQ